MEKTAKKTQKTGNPKGWRAIPRLEEAEIRAAHARGDHTTVEAQACRLVVVTLASMRTNNVMPAWLFQQPGSFDDLVQTVCYGAPSADGSTWLQGVITTDLPRWNAGKMKFVSWIMTQAGHRALEEMRRQATLHQRTQATPNTLRLASKEDRKLTAKEDRKLTAKEDRKLTAKVPENVPTLSLDRHGEAPEELLDRTSLQRRLVTQAAQSRLDAAEKEFLRKLKSTGDNVAESARSMGIPVSTARDRRAKVFSKLQDALPPDWRAQAAAYDDQVRAEAEELERQKRMDRSARARYQRDAAEALFRDTAIATPVLRADSTRGLEGAVIRGSFDVAAKAARVASRTVSWAAGDHGGWSLEEWFQRAVYRETHMAKGTGRATIAPTWEPSFRGWLSRMVPKVAAAEASDQEIQVARIAAWADHCETVYREDALSQFEDLDTGEPGSYVVTAEDRALARNWHEFGVELAAESDQPW